MNLGFNFVRNCGVGYYNLDSAKNALHSDLTENIDRTKIGVFCVSCKPSYRAVEGKDASGSVV